MEKKFIIEKPKKFEVEKTSYPDSALISSVKPIEEGGLTVDADGLDKLVEAPLLDACKILNNKGIRTIFSSANKKDVEDGYGYITIDFGSLSDRNKEIAREVGEVEKIHGSESRDGVYIKIPISENSTVGEVKEEAMRIAQRFEQQ